MEQHPCQRARGLQPRSSFTPTPRSASHVRRSCAGHRRFERGFLRSLHGPALALTSGCSLCHQAEPGTTFWRLQVLRSRCSLPPVYLVVNLRRRARKGTKGENMKHTTWIILFAGIIAVASLAFAQQGGRPPHPPPQEAFDACDGSSTGDTCQFEGPPGTIRGTCQTPVDRLVCVPNHHKRGKRGGNKGSSHKRRGGNQHQ